jgi:hypothetical protein
MAVQTMKTHPIRRLSRAVILGVTVGSLVVGTVMAQSASDLNAVFQQGRAAFYKGDLEQAKLLLTQVQTVSPNHFETKALLAQIKTYEKTDSSSKKVYSAVVIPKLDFSDVTLSEAFQGLGAMAKNASGGKVTPNFVVKNPELGSRRLTLALTNVPLTDAVDYLVRMTNAKAVYEKYAVMISPISE